MGHVAQALERLAVNQAARDAAARDAAVRKSVSVQSGQAPAPEGGETK